MIKAGVELYKATKAKKYLDDAVRTAGACRKSFVSIGTGAFDGDGESAYILCDAFVDLYTATKNNEYLLCVKQNAEFVHHYVRKANGGYRRGWVIAAADEPERLVDSASAAVLFADLALYPDKEELYDAGIRVAVVGEYKKAAERFKEAVDIDDSYVEAHYRLYRCQTQVGDVAGAERSLARLADLYRAGGELRTRMKAVAVPAVLKEVVKRVGA
jgi:uncharacterized protein YyaL (SSP411 family)